jgi:RHS repeat-associated protein
VSVAVTKYIYDGDTVLQEYDGAGVTQKEYTSTAQGYGDLLSAYDGTSAKYYEPDALGSTDALADQSQNVVDRWRYRAFGTATQALGTDSTPYTWVGRQGYQSDSETGLYMLGNGTRYYDPVTARFLSRDPIGFSGGDANLRRYADNRPTLIVDPSGTMKVTVIQNKLKVDCGERSYIEWDFVLEEKTHCEGYIVQMVRIYCDVSNCKDCPKAFPEKVKPSIVYWEAWYVEKDASLAFIRNDLTKFTDQSSQELVKPSCGAKKTYGDIRFYCKTVTKELGRPPGGVGKPEIPPDKETGWIKGGSYTGGGCSASPGDLPHTNIRPDWWVKEKPLEQASRESSLLWSCSCCDQKDFVTPTAKPDA